MLQYRNSVNGEVNMYYVFCWNDVEIMVNITKEIKWN